MGDLSKALPVTLNFEGGFSDNAHDPGGATQKGVTLATFRHYKPGATVDDLRRISDADLQRIYRDGYWTPIDGDTLRDGVDLVAFDYAVNSGVGAAKKALSASLGLLPVPRVKAICARRLSILHGLKTWKYFGKGWNSRVTQVLALGIKWASATPAEAVKELQAAAAVETKAATVKAKAVVAAATPAVVAPAAVVTNHSADAARVALGSGGEWMLIAVGVVALIAAIVLFFSIRHHQDAAAALSAAAKDV